jgi:hypothetical protein
MKNIKFIKTTLIMLFPADDIDFFGINSEISIQKLISNYSLNKVPATPQFLLQNNQLVLQNGIFQNDNVKYIIEQIVIEERKIIISILSSSDISNIFFEDFKKQLIALDFRKEKGHYEPLISTYETICILKLDIDLNHLISRFENDKVEKIISKKQTNKAKIQLIPSSLRFQITYKDIPEKLVKNKITMSDKYLVLELREKTDPEDKIFYTASPTDTETHFEILEAIKAMLS